jgi:GH15 family glucan-1,4-alpha-glucosidase
VRIEDYAYIGDTHTGALVGRDGAIDWLCLPRFNSPSCFAALLGAPRHGRWRIGPPAGGLGRRRYRPGSLVLETDFDTRGGAFRVTDCMPVREGTPRLVRVVEGLAGEATVDIELIIRFDYGSVMPWVRRLDGDRLVAIGGPDGLVLDTEVALRGEDFTTRGQAHLSAGEKATFVLSWFPSNEALPERIDPLAQLEATTSYWTEWSGRAQVDGQPPSWAEASRRSLITLKGLTYAPSGGIVAAPTTSLPECVGGVRNWDYRYCWIRDATFTLYALLQAGYQEEAVAWRDWLLRAVAGEPASMQILYGPAGERRLTEMTLDWLPGYEGSAPVRVGNAAHEQFQLDVYGEVMDTMDAARRLGVPPQPEASRLQRALMDFLESAWHEPDEGIWEVRGPRRHFTHSKVMAWVALDRAVRAVADGAMSAPVERWQAAAAEIHTEVCAHAFDAERNTFTQSYDSPDLDASLLMIPTVGFLDASDPRVQGTVAAIERELLCEGLVLRYTGERTADVDGLPPGEGAFLPCSFWLADVYGLMGRHDEATALFERLLGLANDVGLFSEEFDPESGRMLGNFPQAFTHLSVINTARSLSDERGPARHRGSS